MKKPEFFVTPGYGERQLNEMHYSQIVEFPYVSALDAIGRFEGKPAIYNHMKNAVA